MKAKSNLRFVKVKEFQFGDVLYKLKWKRNKFKLDNGKNGHHRAETEHPLSSDKPEIRIQPDAWQTELSLLQTLIDESIHCYPEFGALENSFVDIVSDQIGLLLFKVGFRLQKKEEPNGTGDDFAAN